MYLITWKFNIQASAFDICSPTPFGLFIVMNFVEKLGIFDVTFQLAKILGSFLVHQAVSVLFPCLFRRDAQISPLGVPWWIVPWAMSLLVLWGFLLLLCAGSHVVFPDSSLTLLQLCTYSPTTKVMYTLLPFLKSLGSPRNAFFFFFFGGSIMYAQVRSGGCWTLWDSKS